MSATNFMWLVCIHFLFNVYPYKKNKSELIWKIKLHRPETYQPAIVYLWACAALGKRGAHHLQMQMQIPQIFHAPDEQNAQCTALYSTHLYHLDSEIGFRALNRFLYIYTNA